MESSSPMPSVPQIKDKVAKFRQRPRPGQVDAFDEMSRCGRKLCVKLPTGYGKTYLALGAYSILKSSGISNRMLVIFPTDAQLQQFEDAVPLKLKDFGVNGSASVCDMRFFRHESLRKHGNNTCQIFAITVQSLIGAAGSFTVNQLLAKGRWLIVVDEYHHYGIDKPFGLAVQDLSYEFLLCMSATPYRTDDDSAFGPPAVSVSYRDAVKHKAVKPLCGHAYHYRIDAVSAGSGDIQSYTTEELSREAGGDSPEKIEQLCIKRKMRWSPKYISPLITNPIDRMLRDRIATGRRLQVIIGCMCVSHAELVKTQVSATFPDLRTEWVGTGQYASDAGRTQEANREIIKRFAPTDGSEPQLDVLVHVGMAGEGLDTINVSEVVHLNAAGVNNSNNQENGRAARYLPSVIGHINFDASSGYAKGGYVGNKIMDAMDNLPACADVGGEVQDDISQEQSDEWLELPDEPAIVIVDVECISIDSGDATVTMMASVLKESIAEFREVDLNDMSHRIWTYAILGVRKMRTEEAEQHNEKARISQTREAVDNAVSVVAGNVIKLMKAAGSRIEKSLVGDIKRRINGRKKRDVGEVSQDLDALKRHYAWVKCLETEIRETRRIPSWLA